MITSKYKRPFVSALLLACALVSPRSLHADYTVTTNKTDNRGVWEGWGTSLCWWGNLIGGTAYQSKAAQLLGTYNSVDYMGNGTALPGLGLNIIRYNVGGGGRAGDVSGTPENISSTLPWHKDIDGYWKNWTSKDITSSSWDWTRDAQQRAMLIALRDARSSAGLSSLAVEFFHNAPMWWMTPSKSSDGGTLQTWNEGDLAYYAATVAAYSKAHWGITPVSIEVFNEPSSSWWAYPAGQEGCIIPVAQQARVIGALDTALTTAGISGTILAASDETSVALTTSTYNTLKATTVNGTLVSNLIDRVNTHTYSSTSASAKQTLRTALGTKKLWMSEYGDSDATGLKLADQIVSDMNYLKPTAWIYWQAIEPAAWGLVMATFPSTSTASTRGAPTGVNQKYYVYAHFTRWIRNGHTLYGTSDQYTVCGYDANNKIMNYVTVNHGTAQKITYDLSAFTTVTGTTATIRATQMTAGGTSYVNSTASIANKTVSIQAGTYTIYTVQVTGVTP